MNDLTPTICRRCGHTGIYPSPNRYGHGWCVQCFKPTLQSHRLVGDTGILATGEAQYFYTAEGQPNKRTYSYLADKDLQVQRDRARVAAVESSQTGRLVNKHLGFIVQSKRPVRLYFDYDGKLETSSAEELKDSTSDTVHSFHEALTTYLTNHHPSWPLPSLQDMHVSYETNPSAKKLSFHAYFPTLVFRDITHMKRFVTAFAQAVPEFASLDTGVYNKNRVMMAPGSAKPGRSPKALLPLHASQSLLTLINAASPHTPEYDAHAQLLEVKKPVSTEQKHEETRPVTEEDILQHLRPEAKAFVQKIQIQSDRAYITFKPDHPCPLLHSKSTHHSNNALFLFKNYKLICFGTTCFQQPEEERSVPAPVPILPGASQHEATLLEFYRLQNGDEDRPTFEACQQRYEQRDEYMELSNNMKTFSGRKNTDVVVLTCLVQDYERLIKDIFEQCIVQTTEAKFTAVYTSCGWKLFSNTNPRACPFKILAPTLMTNGAIGIHFLPATQVASDYFWHQPREVDYFFNSRSLPPGAINLFKGFAYTAEHAVEWFRSTLQGDLDRLKEMINPYLVHVHEIVANGRLNRARYLHVWFYHIFCRGEKTLTVPCLFGKPGAGKSMFTQILYSLIGSKHAVKVSKQREITGDFNSQLEGKILVINEEASYGGSKKEAGAMKDLITSDVLMINKKHEPCRAGRNSLNMLTCSNDISCFPFSTAGDRRWHLMEVNNKFSGLQTTASARAHFTALVQVPLEAIAYFYYFIMPEQAEGFRLTSDFDHVTGFESAYTSLMVRGTNHAVQCIYNMLSEAETEQEWQQYTAWSMRSWVIHINTQREKYQRKLSSTEIAAVLREYLIWELTKDGLDHDASLEEQREHFSNVLSNKK